MPRYSRLIALVMSLCGWSALGTQAQAQDLEGLPGLCQASAPAWLKEGVRLSYYSAVASVPGSMYSWAPNEDGDWVSGDGQGWDRFDQPGAAGHGYTQVDVVAAEPPRVALSLRAWSYHLISGPLMPGARSSLIAAPGGAIGGFIPTC